MAVPTRRLVTPSGEQISSDDAKALRMLLVDSEGVIIYDMADIGSVFGEMLMELRRIRTANELILGNPVGVDDLEEED